MLSLRSPQVGIIAVRPLVWLCTTRTDSYLPRHKQWPGVSIIIIMLNVAHNIARTHRKVDWNAQLFTTRWSRWGIPLSVWLFIKATWAALKFLPPNTNPPIPWHRVIGASGTISSRGQGTTCAQRQRDAFQAEGVEVTTGREMRVNLSEFG